MGMACAKHAFQQCMADSCTVAGHEHWLAGAAQLFHLKPAQKQVGHQVH